MLVSS